MRKSKVQKRGQREDKDLEKDPSQPVNFQDQPDQDKEGDMDIGMPEERGYGHDISDDLEEGEDLGEGSLRDPNLGSDDDESEQDKSRFD